MFPALPLMCLAELQIPAGKYLSGLHCGADRKDHGKLCSHRKFFLEEKEHKHIYFTVPPEVFRGDYWGMDDLEEIELMISDKIPSEDVPGKLVFILS